MCILMCVCVCKCECVSVFVCVWARMFVSSLHYEYGQNYPKLHICRTQKLYKEVATFAKCMHIPNAMAFDKTLTYSDFFPLEGWLNTVRALFNDKTFIFSISYAFHFPQIIFSCANCAGSVFFTHTIHPLRPYNSPSSQRVVDRFTMLIFNDCLILLIKNMGYKQQKKQCTEKRIPHSKRKLWSFLMKSTTDETEIKHTWTSKKIAINFFSACAMAQNLNDIL